MLPILSLPSQAPSFPASIFPGYKKRWIALGNVLPLCQVSRTLEFTCFFVTPKNKNGPEKRGCQEFLFLVIFCCLDHFFFKESIERYRKDRKKVGLSIHSWKVGHVGLGEVSATQQRRAISTESANDGQICFFFTTCSLIYFSWSTSSHGWALYQRHLTKVFPLCMTRYIVVDHRNNFWQPNIMALKLSLKGAD